METVDLLLRPGVLEEKGTVRLLLGRRRFIKVPTVRMRPWTSIVSRTPVLVKCLPGDRARALHDITCPGRGTSVPHGYICATCATIRANRRHQLDNTRKPAFKVQGADTCLTTQASKHLTLAFTLLRSPLPVMVRSPPAALLIVNSPMTSPCPRSGTRWPISGPRPRDSSAQLVPPDADRAGRYLPSVTSL